MIAGIAPYPAPVRDWNAGKAGLVPSGDDDALAAACEADRVASVTLTGDDMAEMFTAEPRPGGVDWCLCRLGGCQHALGVPQPERRSTR